MSVPYGAAIAIKITASALSSLGTILQRKSHLVNRSLPDDEKRTDFKRKLFILGLVLYLAFAGLGSYFSVSSLPILVVAPLGTFTLFFNAVYSRVILHEVMTLLAVFGTIVIAASSAVIAILLNLPHQQKTVEQIHDMLSRKVYIIYILLSLILVLCMMLYSHRMGTGAESFKVAITAQVISTIVASQALIFAKIAFDLLELSIKKKTNQFNNATGVIVLVVTVVSIIVQLFYYNRSLKYCTTIITLPIGYALGIPLACLNTAIYYDSFSLLLGWEVAIVVVSVIGAVVGVCFLSHDGMRSNRGSAT